MDMDLSLFELICSFLLGIVACVVVSWLIKKQALGIVRSQAQAKGQIAKQDAADDLMSFIAEAAEVFNRAKAEGQDLKAVAIKEMPALIARHPRTAIRFGKKLYDLVQGEGSIEGLLGEVSGGA